MMGERFPPSNDPAPPPTDERPGPSPAEPRKSGAASLPAMEENEKTGDSSIAEEADQPEPDRGSGRRHHAVLQGLLALLIVAAAVLLAWYLYTQKTSPSESERIAPSEPVEVLKAWPKDQSIIIEGYGSVQAPEMLSLSPRVSGRVEWLHPGLIEGGFIEAGERVVGFERRDFVFTVRELSAAIDQTRARLDQLTSARQGAEAKLAQARSALERVEAEAAVAVSEFKRIYPERDPPPLVAKEPQLREARAAVKAAEAELADIVNQRSALKAQVEQQQARLAQAQTDLERTNLTLSASSEGMYRVVSKRVSIGDRIGVGQVIAEMYRVGELEVPVPLREDDLRWLRFSAHNTSGSGRKGRRNAAADSNEGSEATLLRAAGQSVTRWLAHVARTQGEVDPRTRLTTVILEVEDVGPLGDPTKLLVPGRFVLARITGREVSGVYEVPREALRGKNQNRVWVAGPPTHESNASEQPGDGENTNGQSIQGAKGEEEHSLIIRQVEVIWSGDKNALVRGLEPGDAVILTRLDIVSEGMGVTIERSLEAAESEQRLREKYQRLRREIESVRQQIDDNSGTGDDGNG